MSRTTLITRCLFALLLCLIGLTGTEARSNAQATTYISIAFQPNQSGYPRGTKVTLAAHLEDLFGDPICNVTVYFHTSGSNGLTQRFQVTTDSAGNAYYSYTVPPVPYSNVMISSSYDGGYPPYDPYGWYDYSSSSAWVRLPIG